MNLFDRAKSILRQMHKATARVAADLKTAEGDDHVGEFVWPVPLDVKHADDWEAKDNETDIDVDRQDGEPVDIEDVREGMEHFFGSLLNFAFNPLRDGKPTFADDELKIAVSPSDVEGAKTGDVMLVVQDMKLTEVPFEPAYEEIDRYEQLMFGEGWASAFENRVIKRFASATEREQVEHLFCCMAQVFGLEAEVSQHFVQATDERDIIVDRDFLALLAEREQSMSADFRDDLDDERGQIQL